MSPRRIVGTCCCRIPSFWAHGTLWIKTTVLYDPPPNGYGNGYYYGERTFSVEYEVATSLPAAVNTSSHGDWKRYSQLEVFEGTSSVVEWNPYSPSGFAIAEPTYATDDGLSGSEFGAITLAGETREFTYDGATYVLSIPDGATFSKTYDQSVWSSDDADALGNLKRQTFYFLYLLSFANANFSRKASE